MPTYATDGEFYFISYMTGPSHVRLGLAFQDEPVSKVKMVAQAAVGSCNHGELDEEEIQKAVLAAVREARAPVARSLHVARVVYIKNDSPRYSLYAHCAKLLVERISSGGDFKPIEARDHD